MKLAYSKLLDRLSQESTWRGIAALLMVTGLVTDPNKAPQIIAAGMTIIGLINILKSD